MKHPLSKIIVVVGLPLLLGACSTTSSSDMMSDTAASFAPVSARTSAVTATRAVWVQSAAEASAVSAKVSGLVRNKLIGPDVAVLFAAKLWPLAFMALLAVGGVSAIEAWRERASPADRDEASPPQPLPRQMSGEEARSILGLKSVATAGYIRAAHRKLISQLHPDKGGTDYLAAKINEARDFLLRALGE